MVKLMSFCSVRQALTKSDNGNANQLDQARSADLRTRSALAAKGARCLANLEILLLAPIAEMAAPCQGDGSEGCNAYADKNQLKMIGRLGARGFGAWGRNQAEAIQGLCIHGWDWIGLDWLDWIGLEWTGWAWIDWRGLDWIG